MRNEITTFEGFFGAEVDHTLVAYAHPSAEGDRTLPTGKVSGAAVAHAEINHGRWIAHCPFCPGGAEFVGPENDGLFFCCHCRNRKAGGDLIRVEAPPKKEQRDAERLLLDRPDDKTRNWKPKAETVADLRLENAKHLTKG